MIIVLMAAWLLGGLLALAVGGAVRVAEARGDWSPVTEPVEREVLTAV